MPWHQQSPGSSHTQSLLGNFPGNPKNSESSSHGNQESQKSTNMNAGQGIYADQPGGHSRFGSQKNNMDQRFCDQERGYSHGSHDCGYRGQENVDRGYRKQDMRSDGPEQSYGNKNYQYQSGYHGSTLPANRFNNQGRGDLITQKRDFYGNANYQGNVSHPDFSYNEPASSFQNKNGNPSQQRNALTSNETQDLFETGVPLGFEYNPTSSFDVVGRLCGENRENLKYVERSTEAILFLRGKGSGIPDPATGQESTEPLQIIVKHTSLKGLEIAEQLVESLIKTVQVDYQEHLENEYKNMENMLGLPLQSPSVNRDGGQRLINRDGGQSLMNRDGGQGLMNHDNGQGLMNRDGGQGLMNHNSGQGLIHHDGGQGLMDNVSGQISGFQQNSNQRYCQLCDFQCPSDELYNIHCQGPLHVGKLQENKQRPMNPSVSMPVNPVSGFTSYPNAGYQLNQINRHQEIHKSYRNQKRHLDKLVANEVMKSFEQLMAKQTDPENIRKLYIQAEHISAQSRSYDSAPRVMPGTDKFCKMCNETVRDMSAHIWSKFHRQGYLFKQLKLGIRSFTAVYHDVILPDMDTEGGRRLAISSMDSYFAKGSKGPSPEVDNENFKEMAILDGHCLGYNCKVCNRQCNNLIPWLQHVMDKEHAKACVLCMVEIGSRRYEQEYFQIPALPEENVHAILREEFDVEFAPSLPDRSLGNQGDRSSGRYDNRSGGFGSGQVLYGSHSKEEWVGGGESPPQEAFDPRRSGRSRSRSPLGGARDREQDGRRRKSRWQNDENPQVQPLGMGGVGKGRVDSHRMGGMPQDLASSSRHHQGMDQNLRMHSSHPRQQGVGQVGGNQPPMTMGQSPNPGPGLLGPPPPLTDGPGAVQGNISSLPVDPKMQMAQVQLQMLHDRQRNQPPPPLPPSSAQPIGGHGGAMGKMSPSERTFILQVQQLTGVTDVNLVLQAVAALRSLGPQLKQLLGNLTPQNIQMMLAQLARQVHPSQQPVLQRILQAFQAGQLNPAMLQSFQG